MDLKLDDEQKLIKQTAARFVDKELIGREGVYLKQREPFLPPGDPARRDLEASIRDELTEQARRVGLWTLELPESLGGSLMSAVDRVLIHREFGRSVLPFRPCFNPGVYVREQIRCGPCGGQAYARVGFRRGAQNRRACRFANFVSARTDGLYPARFDDRRSRSARRSLFVSGAGTRHATVRFVCDRTQGGRVGIDDEVDLTTDATVARLMLRQCKIPNEQLLGYEYEAGAVIAAEQLNIAARCLGIAIRCLAASIEHARNRVTFGRRLAERQAIQWMLADLSVDLRTCTWLTLEAASCADHGLPYFDEAALAKKRAAKMAFQAADTAIQIHGGYGVCKEFPFEGFYREARMMRLFYGREEELDRAVGEKFIRHEA